MRAALKSAIDDRNALCACLSCIELERQTVEKFRRVLERATVALERAEVIGGRWVIAEANGAVRRATHAVAAAERRLRLRESRRKPPEAEVFPRLMLVTDPCATRGCEGRVNPDRGKGGFCYDCRRKQASERTDANE